MFPDELDIFENTIRLLKKHESNNYESASELLKTRWDIVCMYREKFQSMKKLSIKDLGNGKVNVHVGGRESNGVPVCNFKYDGVYKDGHIIVPIQPQGM
ncbi:MAG: hypothetical protein ACK55I_27250, partial [bacterium]